MSNFDAVRRRSSPRVAGCFDHDRGAVLLTVGIDRRGKAWRARVTLPDRSQRSRSFRTKAEAVRWEAEQKTALNRGKWVDPSRQDNGGRVRPAVGSSASSPALDGSPRQPARSRSTSPGPSSAHRRIAAVRPSEVQAWATERSQHLSPINLRNLVSMVRSIFRDAVLDRLCSREPCCSGEAAELRKAPDRPADGRAGRSPGRCHRRPLQGDGDRAGRRRAYASASCWRCGSTTSTSSARRSGCSTSSLTRTPRSAPSPRRHEASGSSRYRSSSSTPLPSTFASTPPATMARSVHHRERHRLASRLLRLEEVQGSGERLLGCRSRSRRMICGTSTASILLAAGVSVVTVANRLGHANPGVTLTTYAHMLARSRRADASGPRRRLRQRSAGHKRSKQDSAQRPDLAPTRPLVVVEAEADPTHGRDPLISPVTAVGIRPRDLAPQPRHVHVQGLRGLHRPGRSTPRTGSPRA